MEFCLITRYASETVKTVGLLQKCIVKVKQDFVLPYYLIPSIIFERFEPYEVKISSTVLRRGRRSNPSSLSNLNGIFPSNFRKDD